MIKRMITVFLSVLFVLNLAACGAGRPAEQNQVMQWWGESGEEKQTQEEAEITPVMYEFLDLGEEKCWTFSRGDAEAINVHFTDVTAEGCVVEWEPHNNYVFDAEYGYKINGQHLGRQECTFRMEEMNTDYYSADPKFMAIDGITLDVNGRQYTFATCPKSAWNASSEDSYMIIACEVRGTTRYALPGYIDEDEVWGNAEAIEPLTDHWQSEWIDDLDAFLFKDTYEARYDDLPQQLKDRLGSERVSLLADDWQVWYPWLRQWVASYNIIEVNELDMNGWLDYDSETIRDFWKDAERGVEVYIQVNHDDEGTQYEKVNLMIIYMYGQWIVTGFKQGFGFEESPTYLAMYGDTTKLESYMPAVEGDHLFELLPYYSWYFLYDEFSAAAEDYRLEDMLKLFLPEDMQSAEVRQKIQSELESLMARKELGAQHVYEFSFPRPNDRGVYTGDDYDDEVDVEDSVVLNVEFEYYNTDYNMVRKAKYDLSLIKVNGTWYIGNFENAGEGGGNS